MPKVNYVAILAAAAAAFVVGAVWYSPLLFGETWMTLRGMDPTAITGASMPAGEMLGEFARWLIVGYVVSRFIARLGIGDPKSALEFGGWMWIAIYTALAGSVLHEGTPWRLYAIHVSDGLVRLLVITSILGVWRARSSGAFAG